MWEWFKDRSGNSDFVFTDPQQPRLEFYQAGHDVKAIQAAAARYAQKISRLRPDDLCIELCLVMAAKHNLSIFGQTLTPEARQKHMTELTDKQTLICMAVFDHAAIMAYCGGDLSRVNQLVNTLDEQVASLDLPPVEHGRLLLKKASQFLGKAFS